MNLHRADRADWETVSPDNRNGWQRLAARTMGIVAPANIVSLLGAAIAFYGIHLMWKGSITVGVITLLIGRTADILDGVVADYTKTKSPFGEGFDATVDKVIILLVLVVIYWQSLLPWPVLFCLIAFNLYNALLGFYAGWIKKIGSHPSKSGKLSSVFAWLAIVLLILGTQTKDTSPMIGIKLAGYVCLAAFIVGAIVSSYGYTKTALMRRK
jgi:phosphatidylglycerophosphate synthase